MTADRTRQRTEHGGRVLALALAELMADHAAGNVACDSARTRARALLADFSDVGDGAAVITDLRSRRRGRRDRRRARFRLRSEEHTFELQSLMRISYSVLCLKNN